jgi:1-acyl-sn-glycerol-3-phosphate acyltransferase
MLYQIIRPIATIGLKIYFKKIYYQNTELIPWGRPIILACNHPTAFFEPVLLCCILDKELHSITRGDLFTPNFKNILKDLNMIPVYRFRDGFANMKQNIDTFDAIFDGLGSGKTLQIFCEGSTLTCKQIRTVQKGAARMAFGTYDKYGDQDLQIVPVGFSYENPHRFGTEAIMDFGKPIPLRDFYDSYAVNENKALTDLSKAIENGLHPLIVNVRNPEDEIDAEFLLNMYRNEHPSDMIPVLDNDPQIIKTQKAIAARFDNENAVDLKSKIENYRNKLIQLKTTDKAVFIAKNFQYSNIFWLLIGAIPALIGLIVNFLPWRLARILKDNKIKQLEFKGPVWFAAGMFITLIYYIILLIVWLVFLPILWIWILPLLLICGFVSLHYRRLIDNILAFVNGKGLGKEIVVLERMRREIITMEHR